MFLNIYLFQMHDYFLILFTNSFFDIVYKYHWLQLNVVLVSTDYSFPYRLGDDPRLGFNIVDIASYIFAGEVPPNKMYELLTTKWGIPHNLAIALIDHYGGHIYDIGLKLQELEFKKEDIIPNFSDQSSNVFQCLQFDGDKKRMRELLSQIAEKGFAPLGNIKDREAEIICKYNVGGVVRKQAANVIGLPDTMWGEYEYGLIPYKQSIRLVIAKQLAAFSSCRQLSGLLSGLLLILKKGLLILMKGLLILLPRPHKYVYVDDTSRY